MPFLQPAVADDGNVVDWSIDVGIELLLRVDDERGA
jgi:hypothetical protein